jgi:hypothetical protein
MAVSPSMRAHKAFRRKHFIAGAIACASESNGVRVKGQSKDGMAVSPHDIQFKSLANGFATLLQTLLPQSRSLNGCQRSAIDALQK